MLVQQIINVQTHVTIENVNIIVLKLLPVVQQSLDFFKMSHCSPHTSLESQTKTLNYEVSSTIGKGAYATVYKGRDKKIQDRYVALKEITISATSEEGIPSSSIREIGLLKQLEKFDHPNVVKFVIIFC